MINISGIILLAGKEKLSWRLRKAGLCGRLENQGIENQERESILIEGQCKISLSNSGDISGIPHWKNLINLRR